MKDMKKIVAANLQNLRRRNNMTQAELAEKINYSDKSVSKWEHGESMPDIEVLCALAEMYGVTLDYLTREGPDEDKAEFIVKNGKANNEIGNKIAITGLIVTAVWFIAAVIYIYLMLIANYSAWTVFLWAVPASMIVLMVMNARWGKRVYGVIIGSVFVWSALLSTCFQFIEYGLWAILIIGAPLQVAMILFYRIKK
ncbi:MAG: helix-turn-helix transcriptional regulator [Clostridia bacterium]|nr:helix-turn-helix transcriptional regulator [Clostridia bacterium]